MERYEREQKGCFRDIDGIADICVIEGASHTRCYAALNVTALNHVYLSSL